MGRSSSLLASDVGSSEVCNGGSPGGAATGGNQCMCKAYWVAREVSVLYCVQHLLCTYIANI